jgi:uncharacterized protein (TIGR03382 family)
VHSGLKDQIVAAIRDATRKATELQDNRPFYQFWDAVSVAEMVGWARDNINAIPETIDYQADVYLDLAYPGDSRLQRHSSSDVFVHPDFVRGSKQEVIACMERLLTDRSFDLATCFSEGMFFRQDLAVVRLQAQPTIQPLRIMDAKTAAKYQVEGATGHSIGFGNSQVDARKREVQVRITSTTCVGRTHCTPGFDLVAAPTDGSRPCHGDSGGPLILDTPEGKMIAGVASRVPDLADVQCAGPNAEVIYSRIDTVPTFYSQNWAALSPAPAPPSTPEPGTGPAPTPESGESFPGRLPGSPPPYEEDGGCQTSGPPGGIALLLVSLIVFGRLRFARRRKPPPSQRRPRRAAPRPTARTNGD